MKEQRLGEFKTVPNTEQKHPTLETESLLVGYIEIDGKTAVLAFTEHELERPADRVQKNIEDLPLLKPSAEARLAGLLDDHNKLLDRYQALCARGFFARLFNRGCQPLND